MSRKRKPRGIAALIRDLSRGDRVYIDAAGYYIHSMDRQGGPYALEYTVDTARWLIAGGRVRVKVDGDNRRYLYLIDILRGG